MLDYLFAALLGVIEGITEWLPISSTGHLILADEFIHMSTSDAFKEMFDVVIQFGAILAVVVIFWSKLWPFRINRDACGSGVSGLVDRYCRKDVWDMWFHVLVAIVPSAVIGLPLDDWMTEHLHNPPVVSAMLILYGVFFLLMESTVGKRRPQVRRIGQINYRMALFIGLFQFLALVPGTQPFRRNDPGRDAHRLFTHGGGRVHVLPGRPHHGGSQSRQGRQVPGRRRRLFRL